MLITEDRLRKVIAQAINENSDAIMQRVGDQAYQAIAKEPDLIKHLLNIPEFEACVSAALSAYPNLKSNLQTKYKEAAKYRGGLNEGLFGALANGIAGTRNLVNNVRGKVGGIKNVINNNGEAPIADLYKQGKADAKNAHTAQQIWYWFEKYTKAKYGPVATGYLLQSILRGNSTILVNLGDALNWPGPIQPQAPAAGAQQGQQSNTQTP